MAGTIIETKALTKRYGALTAVDDLNLTVRQGEVFGLLGPNGAGKTTTTLMLLGLTEPTSGTASISGVDCTRNPIQVKRFVGYLPDNMGFYPDMTGRQNLRMTGAMVTDHSYASGSGVYSLRDRRYVEEYIAASKVDAAKLPRIVESAEVIGTLTPPVGVCLFVSSSISGEKVVRIGKASIPFILCMVAVMFLVVLFPELATFVPSMIEG